jgi:hypothetical protein
MKSDDETPWWCQLLWPWFGRPWYAEIEDPDAFWAAIGRQFAWQAGELAGDLAGDDRPGEGYLAKAGRLTAARYQAEEIIRHESGSWAGVRTEPAVDPLPTRTPWLTPQPNTRSAVRGKDTRHPRSATRRARPGPAAGRDKPEPRPLWIARGQPCEYPRPVTPHPDQSSRKCYEGKPNLLNEGIVGRVQNH